MNHAEVWEYEDTTPDAWERWCAKVQELSGMSDAHFDGQVLADAYTAWTFGISPETFAAMAD